ncbi:manganese efflux pump MntP [Thermaurantiacus sp.]
MVELLLLALALSADAAAAALAWGSATPPGRSRWRVGLETGLACGLAQGLMPLIGLGAATAVAGLFARFGPLVAFAILAVLGLRMLEAARAGAGAKGPQGRGSLLLLALGTSIDAAAAGVTLPLFAPPPLLSALIIGAVTAVCAGAAAVAGGRLKARHGRFATGAGGVLLIGIGLRLLLEHRALPL